MLGSKRVGSHGILLTTNAELVGGRFVVATVVHPMGGKGWTLSNLV